MVNEARTSGSVRTSGSPISNVISWRERTVAQPQLGHDGHTVTSEVDLGLAVGAMTFRIHVKIVRALPIIIMPKSVVHFESRARERGVLGVAKSQSS